MYPRTSTEYHSESNARGRHELMPAGTLPPLNPRSTSAFTNIRVSALPLAHLHPGRFVERDGRVLRAIEVAGTKAAPCDGGARSTGYFGRGLRARATSKFPPISVGTRGSVRRMALSLCTPIRCTPPHLVWCRCQGRWHVVPYVPFACVTAQFGRCGPLFCGLLAVAGDAGGRPVSFLAHRLVPLHDSASISP